MSWPFIALLAAAVVVVIAAEWQRLGGVASGRFGSDARRTRDRQRRKSNLKIVRSETEEFEQSVQRDLAELPTTRERDRR